MSLCNRFHINGCHLETVKTMQTALYLHYTVCYSCVYQPAHLTFSVQYSFCDSKTNTERYKNIFIIKEREKKKLKRLKHNETVLKSTYYPVKCYPIIVSLFVKSSLTRRSQLFTLLDNTHTMPVDVYVISYPIRRNASYHSNTQIKLVLRKRSPAVQTRHSEKKFCPDDYSQSQISRTFQYSNSTYRRDDIRT